MLEKAASGKSVDRDLTKVEGIGIREGIVEQKQKTQDAAAALDDPSYRKLESLDRTMADLLTITKGISGLNAQQLEEMKLKTSPKEGAAS